MSPIYVYLCPHCGQQFEIIQKMDSEPSANCPDCGHIAPRTVSKPSPFVWGRGGPYAG